MKSHVFIVTEPCKLWSWPCLEDVQASSNVAKSEVNWFLLLGRWHPFSFWKLPTYTRRSFNLTFTQGFYPHTPSSGSYYTALVWHSLGPFTLKLFILQLREFFPCCFSDFYPLLCFLSLRSFHWMTIGLPSSSSHFSSHVLYFSDFCIMFWVMSLGLSSRSLIRPLTLFVHYSAHSLFFFFKSLGSCIF